MTDMMNMTILKAMKEESSPDMENRTDRRYPVTVSISYFPFSSQKQPTFTANVINYSRRGLCFQSPYPLNPGQSICVRTEPSSDYFIPSNDEEARLKSFAVAEVRWCREDEYAGAMATGYNIGVRYL